MADKVLAGWPAIRTGVRENRKFLARVVRYLAGEASLKAQWRDSDVFARLAFHGLDLVPPGVVLTSEWPDDEPGPRPTPADVSAYGGVARKP